MSNSDRYPAVTSDWRDWRVTSFQVATYPLEVIRKPDALSPTDPFREEPWRTALTRSLEGRFRPRVLKNADIRRVLITRESLPRLRADLLATDTDRVESVRGFLERWGLLGLREGFADTSIASQAALGTDDVAWTRAWLRDIQRCLYEPKEGLTALWRDLAKVPGAWPWGTFHLIFMAGGRAEPSVQCHGLLDALLMALPLWAEELPPRRCANERCNGGSPRLIPAPRPGQDYCTPACATADRVRRFKRKARALRRLAQGETVAMVAKRYGLEPREVRRWQRAAAQCRSTARRPKGARL